VLVRSFILQNCNHFTIMDELGDKDSLLFQAVLQMIGFTNDRYSIKKIK
jgi:hypothetical protein